MSSLTERYRHILDRIASASAVCKRSSGEVECIAVSKFQSMEDIRAVAQLGQRSFGENYVEELLQKAEALSHLNLRWVFIGQLQSNKIARLMAWASEIQTVTQEKQLRLISKCLEEQKRQDFPIYIQVNLDPSDPRQGLGPEEAQALAKKIMIEFPRLALQGIMAIPSEKLSKEAALDKSPPELFDRLSKLAKKIGEGKLSLGMSQDLEAAIASGSTCIRVGTAIFGKRE